MIWINDYPVIFEEFPNKETRFKLPDFPRPAPRYIVRFRYDTDSDLMKLLFVREALRQYDTEAYPTYQVKQVPVYLDLPYMPYSRMDRTDGPTPFTLRYVANFINSLDFTQVIICSPHSDVTAALVHRSVFKEPWRHALPPLLKENDWLVYPDAGAAKRYGSMFHHRYLVGTKHRNFDTGQITNMSIEKAPGFTPHDGQRAVIVDDLCSYGGTFLNAGQILKEELGFTEVILCVTHLEASVHQGLMITSPFIDHIYATDTLDPTPHKDHPKISILPC